MASSAFLRLEWTDAGTREAIAFAIHEQPQLRTIAWYVDAWRGEGVAVPPDAVAYVSARGGAPVPAPRSRLVQEDCEIRFELPESDIAVILEYTQSDGRRRHHNFALAKPQTIQWVVDDWKKNLGVAVPPEAVAYVSERGATCAPVPRSRLVCKDCEIVFKEADTAGAELVVVVTDESAGIAASPPGFASLTARGVELGGRRWAGASASSALICAFPFEPKDAHTARVYVACEPCSLDRDAVVAAFDAARKIDGVYERGGRLAADQDEDCSLRLEVQVRGMPGNLVVQDVISRLDVDNVLRRMTISEFVAMYVSKNETRVTRLVVAATPLRKSFARRLIDLVTDTATTAEGIVDAAPAEWDVASDVLCPGPLRLGQRGPRMIRLKVICEDAAVGDGRFPPLLRGPDGERDGFESLGDEPPIVVFVTDEKTGDVLLARSIAGTEACLWFTLHDVWTRVRGELLLDNPYMESSNGAVPTAFYSTNERICALDWKALERTAGTDLLGAPLVPHRGGRSVLERVDDPDDVKLGDLFPHDPAPGRRASRGILGVSLRGIEWAQVDLVLRVGNGSGELFRDDLLATFPVPDVINEPSLQDIIVFIFEHRTVGGRLGREFRSVLQMPETRVTLDGVELAPGALQSPLDRSLVQPLALHTPEGEPIVISVLSDEFGERFRRDLAPADDLGTFLVLAKDARGPLWDVLRCPAADNHASVKDAVEDVLEMPGALDAEGASVSFCQGRPEHAEDYHTHFAHLVDGQFVGETQLIEDPASVSVAFLTQRSELARIGDPPFACVVADFPGSTLRSGTRLDVAILHGDDKKDLLKFDVVVRMKLPQVIAQWVGQGIEPTIHRLHAGGEISEKIYDHLCDDVVCEVEEARSIRIAVDGGPERDIDYDDHLGALLGPSPPERVAVTVWLDDRRKKVPRTQWTKLQHGCWATMAKERVMRGEFIYELDCWKRLTVSGTALASVYCVGESAFLEVGVALGLFPWPAGGDVDDEEVLSKVFDVLTIATNHAAAARSGSWAILYKNHAGFPTARHPDMDQPLHSGILSLLKLRKLPELLTIAANAAAAGNKPSCALFGETFDTRPLLDALGRLPVALLHDVKLDWRAYDPEQRATFERALLGLLVLWHLVRPSENYAEQVELAATVEGHDAYRGAVSGAVALQLQMELSKVPRAKEASLRFRRTLQRKHAPEAVLAFVSANIPAGVAGFVDLFSQPLGFGNGDRLIEEKLQLEAQTELPAPKNVGDDAAAKKKKKTRRGGKKKQAGASAPRDADPPRQTGAKDKIIDAGTVGNDAVYSEPAFDPNCAERFRVGRIASSWAGGVCAVATVRNGRMACISTIHDDFGPFGTSVATQPTMAMAHLDVCSIEAMLTREMEPGDFTPVVQIVDFAANRNGRTYRLLVSDGSWFDRCIGSLKLVEEGQLERGCIVRVDNFRIDAEGFEKPTILLEKLTVVRAPCGLVGLPTSYPDRKIMPPLSLAKLPDWDTSNPDAFFCTATDIVALAFATPAHLVVAEADAVRLWVRAASAWKFVDCYWRDEDPFASDRIATLSLGADLRALVVVGASEQPSHSLATLDAEGEVRVWALGRAGAKPTSIQHAFPFSPPARFGPALALARQKKSLYVASAVAIHSISVEHDERFFGLSASDLAENDRRVADGGAFVNCAHCRRYDPERSLVCLGCRRVRYCDATCQRAAWAEHRHHCPASSSFAAGQATPAASRPDDGEATDGEAAPPPPRETDGAAAREIRVHVSVNGAIVKTEVCDFSKYPLDVPISRVTDAFPASVSAIQTLDGAPLPETTRAAEILERHGGDVVLILDFASIVPLAPRPGPAPH
ncbi:hypothetical protein JL722_5888 [Aureococcus anophagefferens]|nr:hypothetical protein JL722_5888 [Aureococcus anophagefferens]